MDKIMIDKKYGKLIYDCLFEMYYDHYSIENKDGTLTPKKGSGEGLNEVLNTIVDQMGVVL